MTKYSIAPGFNYDGRIGRGAIEPPLDACREERVRSAMQKLLGPANIVTIASGARGSEISFGAVSEAQVASRLQFLGQVLHTFGDTYAVADQTRQLENEERMYEWPQPALPSVVPEP